ncbi:TPA: DUF551 domain-containing protein [Escherichia coli]|nr:DUF551 domain-containing protein [Escherichia coli]
MSEINYQALREVAERAIPAMERLLMLPADDDLLSEQELKDYGVDIDAPGYYRTEHLVFAESSVKQWGGRVVPLYTAQPVPVTPDGWISCSERMPDTKTAVLVAREFDRKGDWRMKWATYIPGHPDANDGWVIPGASWIPSHWMPLPEPPQEAKRWM